MLCVSEKRVRMLYRQKLIGSADKSDTGARQAPVPFPPCRFVRGHMDATKLSQPLDEFPYTIIRQGLLTG